MHTRINLSIAESNTVTISVEPSYDKPGEQKVCMSLRRKDGIFLEMFLNETESKKFLKDLETAIKNTEF